MLAQTQNPLWLPSVEDLIFLSPEIVLTCAMLVIMFAAMIFGRKTSVCAVATLGSLVAMFVANVVVMRRLDLGSPQAILEPAVNSPMLIVDSFTVFFKFFLIFFALVVTTLWLMGGAKHTRDAPEFLILLLGSALGMSLMVSSLNLLVIIMAIELASMPSYALVGFDKRSRLGAEGSIKYVIFGSISAAIMLYGATLLYGLFGTLDIAAMAPQIVSSLQAGVNVPLLAIAMFTFVAGIAFKVSAVPFHFWCPDAFEGAQIEVTTWLSVASKAAGLCLLLRVMYALAAVGDAAADVLKPLTVTLGVLAAITCFVGNLAAYRQRSVKRMLAYSSIAHAGYMMMFTAVIMRAPIAPQIWMAVIVYIVMYMFMNLGAFGTTALVSWHTGSDSIEHFNGLGRRSPVLAVSMAVCLFSLVGMPPLGGFIAKFWLIFSLAAAGEGWLWALIIWASLNTLFSLFYYMRIIKHMYLIDDQRPELSAPLPAVAMVSACAVVLLLTGTLLINPVKQRAERYTANMFTQIYTGSETAMVKQAEIADPAEAPETAAQAEPR